MSLPKLLFAMVAGELFAMPAGLPARRMGALLAAIAMFSAPLLCRADTSELPAFNPDRPGIADGSALVGPKAFQIETGVQTEVHRDSGATTRLLYTPTLLRFGVDDHYEWRIETLGYQQSRTSDPSAGITSATGYSPVSLGIKYHFQNPTPRNDELSLGAILRVFPASGSSDFRTHQITGDLRLAADWTLSPLWSINPNVGIGWYEDGQGKEYVSALLPITVNYNISPKLAVFVEPALQTPESRSGGTSLIYDGGVTYLCDPSTQLDFSIGAGASGSTPPHPFIGVGYSHRFGK